MENFTTDLELHIQGLLWMDKDNDSAAIYL